MRPSKKNLREVIQFLECKICSGHKKKEEKTATTPELFVH